MLVPVFAAPLLSASVPQSSQAFDSDAALLDQLDARLENWRKGETLTARGGFREVLWPIE